jgi:hypothetical protein
MINSTLKLKCPCCSHEFKIKVNSIDKLQNEIANLKDKSKKPDDNLDYLRNMFGFK